MGSQNRQASSRVATSTRGGRLVNKKQQQQQHQQRLPVQPSPNIAQHGVQYALSPGLQQSILNVFTQAFPVISQHTDFNKLLQEVKGHLYKREFLAAFGKQEYLDVYASRWSASRALAYAQIFTDPRRERWFQSPTKDTPPMQVDKRSSEEHGLVKQAALLTTPATIGVSTAVEPSVEPVSQQTSLQGVSISDLDVQTASTSDVHVKVLCIGGGAGAEIVALAAAARSLRMKRDNATDHSNEPPQRSTSPNHLAIHAIDIAEWSEPVRKISSALTTAPPLSSYASPAARGVNRPLLDPDADSQVTVTFSRQDVLQSSLDSLREQLQNTSLITIMFTLNELFSTSLPKTTALLLNLTEAIEPSAYLVVVDSPGSYSEIKLGGSSRSDGTQSIKKYPMKWLLDHTLLEVAGTRRDARWTKIEDEDSKWFRIDEKLGLKYGVDLENCRYQIHVFRKVR